MTARTTTAGRYSPTASLCRKCCRRRCQRCSVARPEWSAQDVPTPECMRDAWLLISYKLNRLLPRDISVYDVKPVDSDMHARFSATKRTYHYYIHTRKNPFARAYSCEMHYELDFDKMNEAAAWLLQVDDFGAFCKANTDVKTTLCDVMEARWIACGDHEWYFRISANRFLRNMVRAVVGTLIEVGRGRMTLEQFRAVVAGKSRSDAGESMPGNALFLENVEY